MTADSFATRWVAAVAPHLPPAARAAYDREHFGSPVLREALVEMALRHPVAILPSRAEFARAARELAAVSR